MVAQSMFQPHADAYVAQQRLAEQGLPEEERTRSRTRTPDAAELSDDPDEAELPKKEGGAALPKKEAAHQPTGPPDGGSTEGGPARATLPVGSRSGHASGRATPERRPGASSGAPSAGTGAPSAGWASPVAVEGGGGVDGKLPTQFAALGDTFEQSVKGLSDKLGACCLRMGPYSY
jgi:hypothetical protein